MAVEAPHMNFFPTPNINPYNGGYALPPLSGTTSDTFVPMYHNNSPVVATITDSFPAKAAAKADSGLTYAHGIPISRKQQPTDSMNHTQTTSRIRNGNRCGSFTFLGEDVSLLIQQQQLDMDRLISQHNDEMKNAIEENRKRCSKRIIAAVEEGMRKRLKTKDDEIERIRKLNSALQEKIKSLSVEGQIWRDLARTNEAVVHALRSNLEQVLAAQLSSNAERTSLVAPADDEQSSCGSNDGAECGGNRSCRHCGERESSVLLLPCRHLCLCSGCGLSVHTCPVCKTPKNVSVHVNMSS